MLSAATVHSHSIGACQHSANHSVFTTGLLTYILFEVFDCRSAQPSQKKSNDRSALFRSAHELTTHMLTAPVNAPDSHRIPLMMTFRFNYIHARLFSQLNAYIYESVNACLLSTQKAGALRFTRRPLNHFVFRDRCLSAISQVFASLRQRRFNQSEPYIIRRNFRE